MITLVCGFGRCGSSLTMQMLAVAGLRCAGRYPAFEVSDPLTAAVGREYDAVKWLNPLAENRLYARPPECRVVWVERNPRQQAKSVAKFLRAIGKPITPKSEHGFCDAFREDRAASIAFVRRLSHGRLLVQQFEHMVQSPGECAEELAAFVEQGDADKMAAVVFPRRAACLPGLLEEELAKHGKR